MSFPRLALLALGLPLLAGGCAGAAATAASYGADSVSYAETGKGTSDHFASMVSKKDCAWWRAFRNQTVCREREGDPNPYKINYDIAERMPSEDGVAYAPPLRAAADAPATSWTADAYKTAPAPTPSAPPPTATAEPASTPPPATAEAVSASPAPPVKSTAPKPIKKKTKAHAKTIKKASPHQVASAP